MVQISLPSKIFFNSNQQKSLCRSQSEEKGYTLTHCVSQSSNSRRKRGEKKRKRKASLFWTLNIFHSVTFTMHHCCTISTGISFNKEGLIVKLACQYLIMRSAYTRDTLIKKLTTRQLHWHNQNKFAHRFVWATTKPVLSGADLLCRNSTLKD